MRAWTASELARFLHWAETCDPDLAMGWCLLVATGMRCGEALALRWRDVDLDAGRLQVRRSVGPVKTKGASEQIVEGPTKSGQARVVDIDADTVGALRSYRATRGVSLELVRNDALVLGRSTAAPATPSGTAAGSSSRSCNPARPWGRTSCRGSGCTTSATPTRRFCSPPASR